jgi:hypothetical protein
MRMMLDGENDNRGVASSEQHSSINNWHTAWHSLLLPKPRRTSDAVSSRLPTLCYSRFFIVAVQVLIRCLQ